MLASLIIIPALTSVLQAAGLGEGIESPGKLSANHSKLEAPDQCTSCHESEGTAISASSCLTCHIELKNRISAGKGFHFDKMGKCANCHKEHRGLDANLSGLNKKTFNHADTGFILAGKHSKIEDCSECHSGKGFLGLNSNCTSCHTDNHKGKLGDKCLSCHLFDSWKVDEKIAHSGEFNLSGRHRAVACADCHINGVFKGTPTECQVCHWQRKQDDLYKTKLGIECGKCHTTMGWLPSTWKMGVETGFQLTGNHKARACDECHPKLQFEGVSPACFSCHSGNYKSAKDPNHVAAGFPEDCSICHTTSGWQSGHFDHSSFGFSLTGAHKTAPCASCHPKNRYEGTPGDCYACHKSDYDGTKNPDHRASAFPTDCTQCHTTATFSTGAFNHDTTGFPLTGAHKAVDCSLCHPNGRFQGTSSECYSCHKSDYDGVADPNHRSAGFSTDCTQCHTTTSFKSSSFTHDSTGFPLEGAHKQAQCYQCHKNGQYQGTPTDCYSCHRNDYEGAQSPNHKAAGFPVDCSFCHKPSDYSFSQGHFEHTAFPTSSGAHSHFSCSDCHTNPSNFAQFTCTFCHSKSSTDSRHASVPGYKYEDRFCYACHPNGRAE
jgi:hypothetical protein